MIGIQNSVQDSVGTLWLDNFQVSTPFDLTSRINRVKTLDGGTSVTNYGATELDRDLIIEGRLTPAKAEILKTFQDNGAELVVSYWGGAYLCLIYHLLCARDGLYKITFYIKEKLT